MKNRQVKIRKHGNLSSWESIPYLSGLYSLDEIKAFSKLYDVQEIRWNYINSLQGHYVWGINIKVGEMRNTKIVKVL